MATEAEIKTATGLAIRVMEDFFQNAGVTATSFVTNEEALRAATLKDFFFANDQDAAIGGMRAAVDSSIRSDANLIGQYLREYGKILSFPEQDVLGILDRLYEDYVRRSLNVTSRAFTYGAPSFFSPDTSGANGQLIRLNKDENNFDIESVISEKKTARCVADEHSGALLHQEIFEFRGETKPQDRLRSLGDSGEGKDGSGLVLSNVRAISARDSEPYLTNPSFSIFTGTLTVPTDITGWTPAVAGVFTDFELSTTTAYRGFDGDTTPHSVKFKASNSLKQTFRERRMNLGAENRPFFFQLAYNTLGTIPASSTAQIVITIGAISRAITLGGVATGWNVATIPANYVTNGQDAWYKRFKAQLPEFKIDVQNLGVGQNLYVDDVLFSPFIEFARTWWAPVGTPATGVPVPFLLNDEFTMTDSNTGDAAGTALLQRWFAFAFGRYLPHVVGAGTWVNPA